jgi:hypothetical protein
VGVSSLATPDENRPADGAATCHSKVDSLAMLFDCGTTLRSINHALGSKSFMFKGLIFYEEVFATARGSHVADCCIRRCG